ncbi:MAG TPA: hypothetical protein VJH67_00125 [Candidatus Paceibacterota bacterium]
MELCYGTDKNIRRQYSLTRQEEQGVAEQGEDFVARQMHSVVIEISKLGAIDYKMHPDFFKANSLIWIWVQMNVERVQSNIYILMARQRIFSINELAQKLGMNPSFVGRLLGMKDAIGFGGWNIDNVFRLSSVLDARPELLLQANLAQAVSNEVVNWQI